MKSSIAALLVMLPGASLADAAGDISPLPNGKPHLCRLGYAQEWVRRARNKAAYGSRSVQLAYRIAKDGSVKDIVVARSSDDADADALAMECVQRWTYKPSIKDGQPVELDWAATVSFTMDGARGPDGDDFDIPASSRDNQTCKVSPADKIEAHWNSMSGNSFVRAKDENDAFECVTFPDNQKTCRAKPGAPLYPTVADVIALSTGSKIKLAVDIETTSDCDKILPLTFKNEVPVNR